MQLFVHVLLPPPLAKMRKKLSFFRGPEHFRIIRMIRMTLNLALIKVADFQHIIFTQNKYIV